MCRRRRYVAGAGVDVGGGPGAHATYLQERDTPIGPRLAEVLSGVRGRTQDRIAELQALLRRIDDFEAGHAEELAGRSDFRDQDPRFARGALDSPSGGDCSLTLR